MKAIILSFIWLSITYANGQKLPIQEYTEENLNTATTIKYPKIYNHNLCEEELKNSHVPLVRYNRCVKNNIEHQLEGILKDEFDRKELRKVPINSHATMAYATIHYRFYVESNGEYKITFEFPDPEYSPIDKEGFSKQLQEAIDIHFSDFKLGSATKNGKNIPMVFLVIDDFMGKTKERK